ncbi:hypothetical protein LPJ57_002469, partial [Coemansia sp. RSA 486]
MADHADDLIDYEEEEEETLQPAAGQAAAAATAGGESASGAAAGEPAEASEGDKADGKNKGSYVG